MFLFFTSKSADHEKSQFLTWQFLCPQAALSLLQPLLIRPNFWLVFKNAGKNTSWMYFRLRWIQFSSHHHYSCYSPLAIVLTNPMEPIVQTLTTPWIFNLLGWAGKKLCFIRRCYMENLQRILKNGPSLMYSLERVLQWHIAEWFPLHIFYPFTPSFGQSVASATFPVVVQDQLKGNHIMEFNPIS